MLLRHVSASFEPPRLAASLRALEPRHQQLLTWRFLQARPERECAGLLGIDERALRIHLVRALGALAASLDGRPAPLLSDDEERALSRGLSEAPRDAPAPARRLDELAAALTEHGPRIDAALRRAQLEAELSPARVREDWARRIAIGALVLLAAFFYWKNELSGR